MAQPTDAAHYEQTRSALMEDPVILNMLGGLDEVPDSAIMHEDGTATHEFTLGALDEYRRRGGTVDCHIGGPAQALLRLRKQSQGKTRGKGTVI